MRRSARARASRSSGDRPRLIRVPPESSRPAAAARVTLKQTPAPETHCREPPTRSIARRARKPTVRPKKEAEMGAVKKILMVDDDPDLREALADQLVQTEEFDVFEAGRRRRGAGARARAELRPRHPRRRPARHGRPRALPADAQAGRQVPDHHADRPRHRQRPDPRARRRRQRLRRQAVQAAGAAGADPRPAPPARAVRGRGLRRRPLQLPARRRSCCSTSTRRRSG